MRISILLLLLLVFKPAQGQDLSTELKHFLQDVDSINQLKSIKKTEFVSFDLLVFVGLIERDLDFGYRHHRFLILPVEGPHVRLNLVSREGHIKSCWFLTFYPGYYLDVENIQLKDVPSSNFLNDYLSLHNNFYKTSFEKKDMLEQLTFEYEVGYGCGFRGMRTSTKTKEAMKYVVERKKAELSKMLNSISPELQTLGAMGLITLKTLNDQQKKIIRHLSNRNSIINSCKDNQSGFGERFGDRVKY